MHPSDHPDPLINAAIRLTDGQPVDWGEVSADLDVSQRSLAARLAELERLARAFRAEGTENVDPTSQAVDELKSDVLSAPESGFLFTWGPLWVLERLGEGGYGEVYRAFDPRLQRDVALKLLHEDATIGQDELLAEARRLAQLRHPNIVTVHGVDAHDDRVGVWFERLEGRDLATIVREGEPMAAELAVELALGVSAAVRAVHDAGWIHGDVKPANVVLEPDGRPVLVDFGAGRATSTTSAFAPGTPLFLPPEALEGAAVGAEGDVYALGVLLFYLLSGTYPVTGDDLDELIAAHRSTGPRRISEVRGDVASAVESLLVRALSPNPESRFADAAAWIGALESCRRRLAEVRESLLADDGAGATRGSSSPLPIPEFAFVGRSVELGEISRLAESHRLVTLVGAGGAGKTRLALEWALRARNDFPDRIAWVDLSAVRETDRLPQVVADALGLTDTTPDPLLHRLRERLAGERTLLVLDNCEHLRQGCAEFIEEILPPGGDSLVLATSREAFRLQVEATLAVPPLGIPHEVGEHPEQLIEHEAVELLVRRFRDVDPSFRLDAARAEPVARIVQRLDGLPLALELAAGRLRVLPVEQIADRLDDRFRFLTGGHARHQTLRAMVDWSYESLSPEERTLLARTSVFAGGWTVSAMEVVCADPAGASIRLEEASVLDLLTSLREKFLVVRETSSADPGASRLRLLETLRVYAQEKLATSGEAEWIRMQHARYFLDEMGRVYPMLKGDEQPQGLARIAAEHENHLLALETFTERAGAVRQSDSPGTHDDTREAWRITDGFGLYWWVRGHWGEADRVLGRVLDLPGPEEPSQERVQVRLWHGHFCSNRGETELARQSLDAALDEARQLGRRGLIGRALSYRGQLAYAEGKYEEAIAIMEEALAVHDARGDSRAMAIALATIGNTAEMQGDLDGARVRFERSLELARDSSDMQNVGYALQRLAAIAIVQRRIDDAEGYTMEAIPVVESLGNSWGRANTCTLLGDVALHRGDRTRATEYFRKSLGLYVELGDSGSALRAEVRLGFLAAEGGDTVEALRWFRSSLSKAILISAFRDVIGIAQGFAEVAYQLGNLELSARLYGAGEGMAAHHGVELWSEERSNLDRARTLLLDDQSEPRLRAAWDEARALSDPEVIALCRTVGIVS